MRRRWVIVWTVASLAGAASGTAEPPPRAAEGPTPQSARRVQDGRADFDRLQAFTLDMRLPRLVVVRDHEGTPWTAGSNISQAAGYMASIGSQGPLFIRHAPPESGASEQAVRLSVGFFVAERGEVEAPYRLEEEPGGEHASVSVEGPPWKTAARIQQWAEDLRAAGLDVAGPIFEYVSEPEAPAQGSARRTLLESRVVRRSTSSVAEANPPAESVPSETPPPAPQAPPAVAEEEISAEARDAREALTRLMEGLAAGRADLSAARFLWDAPAEPAEVDVTIGETGRRFLEGRFEDAAERLLPARRRYSREKRTWLARFMFALQEIQRAAQAADAGLATDIDQFRDALRRRAERARLDLPEVKDLGIRARARDDADQTDVAILRRLDQLAKGQWPADDGGARPRLASLLDEADAFLRGD